MRTCATCHEVFEDGDRIVGNRWETFIFKPANVEDTVNAAEVSPDELRDSRRDHKKTEMATLYIAYKENELPEGLLNLRHLVCSVTRTGEDPGRHHPLVKHAVRYTRSMVKR